ELYPTRVRALGVGAATAWLRLASMIGPTVVGMMLAGGLPSVFVTFAIVAAVAAAVTRVLPVETQGRGPGGGPPPRPPHSPRPAATCEGAPIRRLPKPSPLCHVARKSAQSRERAVNRRNPHALIEIGVCERRCRRASRRERSAGRRSCQDPHLLGRPRHQLG